MNEELKLRPVCFMIMPFCRKKTGAANATAPGEVDFDVLWDLGYRPAIEATGYTAVRADFDAGPVIVKDMIERLAYADLILADVSLPNGNVYYELGLRHVAQEKGCIMFAADWSRQLFDIRSFTSVRYSLSDTVIGRKESSDLQQIVQKSVIGLRDSKTPWHEFIGSDTDRAKKEGVFKAAAVQLSRFQERLGTVRHTVCEEEKCLLLNSIIDDLPKEALLIPSVAIELLYQIRDHLGWDETIDFISNLDFAVSDLPVVKEQKFLAIAKNGDNEQGIAALEEMNKIYGESPERMGLIGGRYKRLWLDARVVRISEGGSQTSLPESIYLDKAIDFYSRGMKLDFNQFYCSSNIALLLAERAEPGDAERAVVVDHFVVAACQRAIDMNEDDEWTRPTLLGAAFRSGDVYKAKELAKLIEREGVSGWKLDTTMVDLNNTLESVNPVENVESLKEVYSRLNYLKNNR